MAALGSQSIASSYEQILQVDRDGGGNTTNLVAVKDGDNGTTFALQLASDNIKVDGTTDLDGQVTINESGADKDFRVEGDTEQNLLFCDASTDRVGIGTSNPAQELDLVGQFISADNKTNNTDKQAIFLSHQYSITSEPEGFMMMETYSGASDNRIDIGGGNSGYNSATSITFNTGANTTTRTGTERLRIDSSGNVGIGTASPGNILDVTGIPTVSLTPLVSINNDGTTGHQLALELDLTENAADNNSSKYLNCTNGTVRCVIYSDGDIQNHDNSYGSISDERIKQDIRDANSQWDDIKALKVRNFKRKDDMAQYGDDAWEQIGVVAQEVEEAGMDKLVEHSPPSDFELEHCGFGTKTADAIPATYYEESDDIPEGKSVGDVKTEEVKEVWSVNQDDDGNDMQVKSMKYSILYMKAVKALQEAMGRIESLESKVEALEG